MNKTHLDYDLNYSESSKKLSNRDSCGAVDICGVSFNINHPKRKGLNHLTQLAIPDMSILDDPESPMEKLVIASHSNSYMLIQTKYHLETFGQQYFNTLQFA